MSSVKYVLPTSRVDISFWKSLARWKLHHWKLSTTPRRVTGFLQQAAGAASGVATAPQLLLSRDSFAAMEGGVEEGAGAAGVESLGIECVVPGRLHLFNTLEDFKAADRQALLEAEGHVMMQDVVHGRVPPESLARFVVLVYADLKHYKFVYWIGFPAAVHRATASSGGADALPVISDPFQFSIASEVALLPEGSVTVSSQPLAQHCALLLAYLQCVYREHEARTATGASAVVAARQVSGGIPEGVAATPVDATPALVGDVAAAAAELEASMTSGAASGSPAATLAADMAPGQDVLASAFAYSHASHLHTVPLLPAVFIRASPAEDSAAPPIVHADALCHSAAVGSGHLLVVDFAQETKQLGWVARNAITAGLNLTRLPNLTVSVVRPSRFLLSRAFALLLHKADKSGLCIHAAHPLVAQLVEEAVTLPSVDAGWRLELTHARAVSGARAYDSAADLSFVGWEPNAKGLMAPRVANARAAMDPVTIAETAAQLNLSLMRWRMLPELDMSKLAACKCLLIGAGTLGCHVSRDLLAWGISHITFVDNGSVSFGNPVRQPLYEFADAVGDEGGKKKAPTAAAALQRIHPRVTTRGVVMSVPMPGHPVPSTEVAATAEAVRQLEELIKEHDIVFLLTDTRESRWLPTMLATLHGKLAITVALGFDSYLVMRHGVRDVSAASEADGTPAATPSAAAAAAVGARPGETAPTFPALSPSGASRVGCYYCTDVVAPKDSTQNRALDQQCTVTRPGGAPISSAVAVELLVALLHHPQGVRAPAEDYLPLTDRAVGPLGVVPHQIRGFLAHATSINASTAAFPSCTACSNIIYQQYQQRGMDFLMDVFNRPEVLEEITGLVALHASVDDLDYEWDE